MSLLITALAISMASLGFRLITDKGMIFYFLRKPFDDLSDKKTKSKSQERRKKAILYAMKPVMLCSTCMASVHTLVWYWVLYGGYDKYTILVMLMVAFLNTFLHSRIKY